MDRKELYQSIAKRRTEYGIVHSRTAMDDFMILKRWAEGHTIERIAEKFPCSVSKVNTALRRMRIFANSERYYIYKYKGISYRVSTCKIFKGLEATAIIMLDLNKNSFIGKKGMNFYVGTSRAKRRLDLICQLAVEDYFPVVHELDSNAPKKDDVERMKTILGNTFSVKITVE